MTIDNSKKGLGQNKTDFLVATVKSIVGAAPFVGPLLSELIGTFIPGQRTDRLSKFVTELDIRLSKFEKDFLEEELRKDDCTDLFEEGFRQATRSLSDERRSYIASVVENGLINTHVSYAETKHLLQILEELNDAEIIWLRFYLDPTIGGDEEFREKHKNIVDPIYATIGSSQDQLDKHALQESYKNHIERLGLIRPNYRFDRKSGIPEFDKFTGKQAVSYYDLTSLGKLFLRFIGITNNDGS